jgi:hypothetical protein
MVILSRRIWGKTRGRSSTNGEEKRKSVRERLVWERHTRTDSPRLCKGDYPELDTSSKFVHNLHHA